MRIFKLITLHLLVLTSFTAQGKGIISFEKTTHDFGFILERDGDVSYSFTFTNTGDEPVNVNYVSASCECTTPDWTKTPVLPGEKGSVTATYLPAGRPGIFDKSLAVMSDAQEGMITIYVKGDVVDKIPSIEDQYSITIGKYLRLASTDMTIARITNNEIKTASVSIYNSGTEPIKLTFEKVPPHITISVEPAIVESNSKAIISCKYDASKKSDWGFTTDKIPFRINKKKQANAILAISTTILDDFSKLTSEQRASGPYPHFRVSSQKFDNTLKGTLINTSFILTNSGETSMNIRKVSSENLAVTTSVSKAIVKAGESVEIKVSVDTSSFDEGEFSIPISVFSDSPRNPQTSIMVTGTIIK